MSFRCDWHRQPVELQTANDGIEEQQTTPFVAEGRRHFMRTTFDLPEEPLHDIVGANRLPMVFRKRVEGQTGLQIARHPLDGRGIDQLVFLDEGGHGLVSGLSILLVEHSSHLRFDLVLLLVWDVAEHIVHLVHHTPLSGSRPKFRRDRIEHGLVAIAHP